MQSPLCVSYRTRFEAELNAKEQVAKIHRSGRMWACMKTLPFVIFLSGLFLAVKMPLVQAGSSADRRAPTFDGWFPTALRDEIRPAFRVESASDRSSNTVLVIQHDTRE